MATNENPVEQNPDSPEASLKEANNVKSCVFCRILQAASSGNILFSDEQVFCIRDIRPASTHHILVLPKQHLPNAARLTRDRLPLLQHMEQVGLEVAKNQVGAEVDPNDVIMGFHWPPFSSQSHLHLHVIFPKRQMGWLGKLIFWPGTYWFVTSQWLRSSLENL